MTKEQLEGYADKCDKALESDLSDGTKLALVVAIITSMASVLANEIKLDDS